MYSALLSSVPFQSFFPSSYEDSCFFGSFMLLQVSLRVICSISSVGALANILQTFYSLLGRIPFTTAFLNTNPLNPFLLPLWPGFPT